jgi:hypothetical protein
MIPNPNYQGPYSTRQIPNENYYVDLLPHNFPEIIGAGFELWIITKDIGIGKIYINDNESALNRWNLAHFIPKHETELNLVYREPEVLSVEDVPKTTSTPWPSPTIRGFQPYDQALWEFWIAVRESRKQLFERAPEVGYLFTLMAVGLPFAIYQCARIYRRRRRRGRERHTKGDNKLVQE